MAEKVERRLAAILAADVVGYSRLMEADEAGTLARLQALRRELIDLTIAEHGGRTVKLMGDGALVEFPSVVGAVDCAAAIQRQMAVRNAELPDDRRLVFRIGINVGDILVEGDDIYGDGVNVAARMEQLAEPGGICLSDDAYRHVARQSDLGFADLGEQQVKNIARPVRSYRVVLDPVSGEQAAERAAPRRRWVVAGSALAVVAVAIVVVLVALEPWVVPVEPAREADMAYPLPEEPSIAVLPFGNVGGNLDDDFLAAGITNDITAHLSKDPSLFVIDRTSAAAYAGRPVKEVAEALGVQYVLQGTVQGADGQLRVTAEFIDALTGRREWSERYDRPTGELFTLQDDITRSVSVAVGVVFRSEQVRAERALSGENLESWELLSRAHHHMDRLTKEDNAAARALLHEAVEIGGEMPAFLSLIAWTHYNDAYFGFSDDPAASIAQAKEFYTRVETLAPDWAGTRILLAVIAGYEGDQETAIDLAQQAVAMDPNNAGANWILASTLNDVGRTDEALPLIRKAMRLNPMVKVIKRWLANIQVTAGDLDGALATAQELADDGDIEGASWWRTLAHGRAERMDDAAQAFARFLEHRPDFTIETARGLWRYKTPEIRDRRMAVVRALGMSEQPSAASPERLSIAVLPFDNLSSDLEQEWFASGITDDLITDLSKISNLFVIARNTSFNYRGRTVDMREVGRDLGVRHVLAGSVRVRGDDLRINARLIDTETGGQVWAERYDGKSADMFALQDAVINRIVDVLAVALTPDEQTNVRHRRTSSIEARAHYQLAEEARAATIYSADGLAVALREYEKAIALDPNFADAYSGYADTALQAWIAWHPFIPAKQARARAESFADRAFALDPNNVRAIAVLARIKNYDRAHDDAVAMLRPVAARNPNDAYAHRQLAIVLAGAGLQAEAIDAIEMARRLDPTRAQSPIALSQAGLVYFHARRYTRAAELLEFAAAAKNDGATFLVLGAVYAMLGRSADARNMVERSLAIWPANNVRIWHDAYASNYLKKAEDRDHFLNALREAGLPELAFGVEGSPEDRLTGDEIRTLMSAGNVMIGHADSGPGPVSYIRWSEPGGSEFITAAWPPSTSPPIEIRDDLVCYRSDVFFLSKPFCTPVYRNAEGTKDALNQYWEAPSGLQTFSSRPGEPLNETQEIEAILVDATIAGQNLASGTQWRTHQEQNGTATRWNNDGNETRGTFSVEDGKACWRWLDEDDEAHCKRVFRLHDGSAETRDQFVMGGVGGIVFFAVEEPVARPSTDPQDPSPTASAFDGIWVGTMAADRCYAPQELNLTIADGTVSGRFANLAIVGEVSQIGELIGRAGTGKFTGKLTVGSGTGTAQLGYFCGFASWRISQRSASDGGKDIELATRHSSAAVGDLYDGIWTGRVVTDACYTSGDIELVVTDGQLSGRYSVFDIVGRVSKDGELENAFVRERWGAGRMFGKLDDTAGSGTMRFGFPRCGIANWDVSKR